MTEIVTVGWLTLDDIVLTDGNYHQNVVGGGSLYSAIGAQIWNESVGIHSVAGVGTIGLTVPHIAERGIDVRGIGTIEGNGLQLWLLHESEVHKQQVPKLSSSRADDLDAARGPLPDAYRAAKGFHIAPQTPKGSVGNARALFSLHQRPIITLDLLSDSFIDASAYKDLSFLHCVSAFLPSEAEIQHIWQPDDLAAWLVRQAKAYDCNVGAKLGEKGVLICEAGTGRMLRLPSYKTQVLDTTGAGDGFCGGFLAGLVAGKDLVTAAAMGTVSASYVIEARGALATYRPSLAEREARLNTVLADAQISTR
jgi:ribokinase